MNLLTSDVVSVASERSGYLPQTPQTLSDKLRDLLMVCAGDKADMRAKAEQIMYIVGEQSFWRDLTE